MNVGKGLPRREGRHMDTDALVGRALPAAGAQAAATDHGRVQRGFRLVARRDRRARRHHRGGTTSGRGSGRAVGRVVGRSGALACCGVTLAVVSGVLSGLVWLVGLALVPSGLSGLVALLGVVWLVLIATPTGDGWGSRVLLGARPPRPHETDLLCTAAATPGATHPLAPAGVRVSASAGAEPVRMIGRWSVVSAHFLEALSAGSLSPAEAETLAIAARGRQHATVVTPRWIALPWLAWTLPWRALRDILCVLASTRLGRFVTRFGWPLRGLLGAIAALQSVVAYSESGQTIRLVGGITAGVIVGLTYLLPAVTRGRTHCNELAEDQAVAEAGLASVFADLLRRANALSAQRSHHLEALHGIWLAQTPADSMGRVRHLRLVSSN